MGFQPLTNVTNNSMSDVAGVLETLLIVFISKYLFTDIT